MRIERASNTVSDKLRRLTGDISWGGLFSRSKQLVVVRIRAEEIDFDRAEVFIDDLNRKTRGAFAELTVEHLVHILYDEFLLHIREFLHEEKVTEDTLTLEDTVKSLLHRRKIYFPRMKKSEVGELSIARKRWAYMEVQLRREVAKRGMVFLHDATSVFPQFEMSLPELMSILFVDFVDQLRRGNQQVLINMLIDKFYSHGFDE